MRANPCKERAVGCTGDPRGHSTRCDHCKRVHNDRENARRLTRRKQFACWVCGAAAEQTSPGVYSCTCKAHAHYRAEMAKAAAEQTSPGVYSCACKAHAHLSSRDGVR